ncbi:D-ribose pyranase [Georgenia thermotolerans]|uniref:D-ribose pyranase n=1 Tax=Georgenia thermotolerans TaxID=527326 RepID=A0A7J5UT19_9MICO|nr:D-ribose pyranase [Georgenia thermotolerans]KAE8765013.1 D-ribose pyranase [Georgenia thermotolerans]
MKRTGILNAELAAALARLGHTDLVVIGDCGLPRPAGVPVVDLALTFGVPSFAQVVDAVAAELVVEQATVASEIKVANPDALALVTARFGEPAALSHEDFKAASAGAKLFVRTGEATPYANVLLRCGVPF